MCVMYDDKLFLENLISRNDFSSNLCRANDIIIDNIVCLISIFFPFFHNFARKANYFFTNVD